MFEFSQNLKLHFDNNFSICHHREVVTITCQIKKSMQIFIYFSINWITYKIKMVKMGAILRFSVRFLNFNRFLYKRTVASYFCSSYCANIQMRMTIDEWYIWNHIFWFLEAMNMKMSFCTYQTYPILRMQDKCVKWSPVPGSNFYNKHWKNVYKFNTIL